MTTTGTNAMEHTMEHTMGNGIDQRMNFIETEHEKPLLMRILFGGNNKPQITTPEMVQSNNPNNQLNLNNLNLNNQNSSTGSTGQNGSQGPPIPEMPKGPQVPIIPPVTEVVKVAPVALPQPSATAGTPNAITKINQTGGKKKVFFGGGDPRQFLADSMYFRKLNNLFIILFLSILLAVFIGGLFVNILFPDESTPDAEFELAENDLDYKMRWKRIIRLIMIFILLIILSHVIIYMVVLFFYAIKFSIKNDDPNVSTFKMAFARLKEIIWKYIDDSGAEVSLIGYYVLLFVVLFGMFIFFIIYTQLSKGYFTNILYETVYNPKKEVKDRKQPQKLLFQYAVYILVMMLFVLLLLNYTKLLDKKIIFIYNIIFVIIYVIFTINILRFLLQRNLFKFFIFLILLIFLALFCYGFLLKNMAKLFPS